MQIIACLIPLVMCSVAAAHDMWGIHIAAMALILVLAGALPAAKRIESIFVFVLVAVSTIPLNISVVTNVMSFVVVESTHVALRLCWAVVIYGIAFNIEEIFMILISRIIWPHQRSILGN